MKTSFFVFVAVLLAVTMGAAQAQKFHPIHEFNGADDGRNPQGRLLLSGDENIYGTTFAGGKHSEGTVFKIDNGGVESVLFSFDFLVSGGFPATPLIQDQAGNLYGAADGGPGGAGVVYKITPEGDESILFAFQGCLNCHNPRVPTGGLIMDKRGNLYGTTLFGGSGDCQSGCGTIYRLDPAGQFRVLYSFTGGADGSQPAGPLVPDANGNLYGVAKSGGNLDCAEFPGAGCGTVFRLTRNGRLNVLHTFLGEGDGATPQPDLLLDLAGGNIYGAASKGGQFGRGAIFRISSAGKYAVVHHFTGGNDGSTPNGGLLLDEAGNLFGTAQTDGRNLDGTAFVIAPTGKLNVLHAFTGDLDGSFPTAGLVRRADGHLFGTAISNGLVNQQNGDVFEIRP